MTGEGGTLKPSGFSVLPSGFSGFSVPPSGFPLQVRFQVSVSLLQVSAFSLQVSGFRFET